jgi:hypothetical protein
VHVDEKQSYRKSAFVSRSRKRYRRPRKEVEFAVAGNREIPRRQYPDDVYNSAKRLAISREDLLPGAEMGLIDSKLQRKSCGGGFGAKKTEGRLIKCKLERKMTVVIYRHKFAIHRVSLGLETSKKKKANEDVAASAARSFALVISERPRSVIRRDS